jgi:hypothetical protein
VLVRAPAIPALRSHLSSDFSIFLDDIDRPAERETLRLWAEEVSITTTIVERIALGIGSSDGGITPGPRQSRPGALSGA